MFQVISVLLCLLIGCCQSDENLSLLTRVPDIIEHLCPGSNVCSNNRTSNTSDDISFKPGTESCCADWRYLKRWIDWRDALITTDVSIVPSESVACMCCTKRYSCDAKNAIEKQCSCSATCTDTGNCCYPNTLSSEKIFELTDFRKYRSCLYPMIPQPSVDHHLYQSFLMVSSVPKPGTVGVSNVSCGDMNVAPWGSFYPVYSAKSKQIYKNMECAREDGEDSDLLLWDAVINCKNKKIDQVISMTIGLDTNSLPRNCHINFVFPGDNGMLQPHKCFINLINTCTESRDFDVPEGINVSKDGIRTLCTKSGLVSPYRARKMYANVFCHICSAETFYRKLFCNKYSEGFDVKGVNDGGFVALIDGKFITENRGSGDKRDQLRPIACSVKEEDSCRQIFCPTGLLRDRTSKCVYPNKIWYNQNYAVYVNLTLNKAINVSEVFETTYGTILPSLKSAWLKRWFIDSLYFRVMDVPYMSNNFVISIHRQFSIVKPDVIITNIKKMIGQTWSIRLGNDTEILTSSNFSIRTDFWRDRSENKDNIFYNLTENFEKPMYKRAYVQPNIAATPYIITRLYFCDQAELEPSEFLLSKDMNMIYIYTTKRFMFNGQFTLVQSPIEEEYRARICIDDSGLRATTENFGTMLEPTIHSIVVASLLSILQQQRFYQL